MLLSAANCEYPTLVCEEDGDDSSIGLSRVDLLLYPHLSKAGITTSSTQDDNSGCDFRFTDPPNTSENSLNVPSMSIKQH